MFANLVSGVGGSVLGSSFLSLARILESKNLRAGSYFLIQPFPFCSRWGSSWKATEERGGGERELTHIGTRIVSGRPCQGGNVPLFCRREISLELLSPPDGTLNPNFGPI